MRHFIYLFIVGVFLYSCKKPPGKGGNSYITGKVTLRKYNTTYGTFSDVYPGAEVKVYVIFGNEISYGDDTKTDYNGNFIFKYLTKGKYHVYVYTTDTITYKGPPFNPKAPKQVLIKDIEITQSKQTVDVGEFIIAN